MRALAELRLAKPLKKMSLLERMLVTTLLLQEVRDHPTERVFKIMKPEVKETRD